jgi:hypothetical protein
MALFLILNAAMEWLRFYSNSDPSPRTLTIIALIGTGLAIFVIRQGLAEARHLRLGRDGERVVADMLQELVASGWHVFHDIPGNGFNIDHVAIGPGGIFAIETKTRSKPEGKPAKVVVDRAGISVGGGPASREALDQASAQSVWLTEQLKRSTSKSFHVRPVVLFPNWYVVQKCPRKAQDPWVLAPKAFLKWVKRGRTILVGDQIALASFHLSRIVKAPR